MPVTPWFDREELLTVLLKRLTGFKAGYRQNIALLGPEAIGKTLLIKRFFQHMLSPSGLVVVYLSLEEGENFGEWAVRFLESLLYGALRERNAGGHQTHLSALFEGCSAFCPQTVAAAKRLLALIEEGKNEDVYDQMWDLLTLVTQETGVSCVVVLDEFHRLDRLHIKDVFLRLGRKIMVQNSTFYMVVSSQPQLARLILREGLHLLFGQFETLEIGPLSPLTCINAARAIWPQLQKTPFLEYLLVELAQGFPGSLDILLQGLLNQKKAEPVPQENEQFILDLLEILLLDSEAALPRKFEAQLRALPAHHDRRFWIQVLCAVANGAHRNWQIVEKTRKGKSETERALRILEQNGFLLKQGVFYRVTNRLFQLWLLTAYPLTHGGAFAHPAHMRARFRDEAWDWVSRLRDMVHRPFSEQCMSFLEQWQDEAVEVEGWRVLLPSFSKIEFIKEDKIDPVILAQREGQKGKSWLIVPWAGLLAEDHARDIVQQLKKPSLKEHRKLLLGGYPVEMNARLILQEAKIRVWDLEVINDLFDLYGVPRTFTMTRFPNMNAPITHMPESNSAIPEIKHIGKMS